MTLHHTFAIIFLFSLKASLKAKQCVGTDDMKLHHTFAIIFLFLFEGILHQGCGAMTFLVGSGSGSGEAIRLRLRLRVKLFCGSGSGSGSGQNVPAPAAPAPMIKSSYFQKCQMSKYDFLLTWP